MGILSSEKIFVDPNEEINFVIDRALRSEKERIILVIPQNSILLSSPVSVNILFKELAKTKKLALIVTEDEYGATIARKIGFIVVPKVSQITAEEWESALSKKLKYLDLQERRKRELLSNIGLIGAEPAIENPSTGDISDSLPESTDDNEKELVAEFKIDEEDIEETIEENNEQSNAVAEPPSEDEAAVNFFKKPRKEGKVIDVGGGIKLAAAGDIRSFLNPPQDDKIPGNQITNDMEDIPERKVRNVVGSSSFAGKDFTKQVKPGKSTGVFGNIFSAKRAVNPEDEFEANLLKKARRKKIMIIGGVIGLILLLGGGYLFAFQLSSVDISIKFKKEDVSGSANVLVNPDVTEISFNPAVIPAKILREENVSLSRTGEANGSGKKGVKAKGFVTIYNLTDKAINLNNGTKLTNTATDRQYVIKQDVALEAGSPNTAYYADNIEIEASDFGSEYNIPVSSDSTSLEVQGYSAEFASKKIYARVFNEISGGTSETFTSVSEENVEALKEKIMPELKSQGESKIRTTLPTGYTLISDSLKFTETSESPLPKVGEESTDKKFTLSIEGTFTAYAVANDDLKMIAERVLSENQDETLEEDDNLVVDNIELPQITEVSEASNGVIITISTQASIGVRPSDENIKNAVVGRSLSDAYNYLDSVEAIDDVRVNFTPSFIPESIRRVPSDPSRISIRIR